MAKDSKILYSAIAGKTLPLVGLLGLLGFGTGTGMGEEMDMDGMVGMPMWVTVGALLVGAFKVGVDAWATHRTKTHEEAVNRAAEAEEKAKAKTAEAEALQREVYQLRAKLSVATTIAENAGASSDDLALRE